MKLFTPGSGLLASGALAFAACTLLLFAATIGTYPPPTCDESIYASSAVALLEQGNFGVTLFPAGDPFLRDKNMVQFGRAYIATLAVVLRVGGIAWLSARAHAMLGWLLAAGLAAWLGVQLHGRWAGFAVALLFASNTKAFLTAHLARPESWTAASILLAACAVLWLLRARAPHAAGLWVAGALAAWPADFHGLALVFTLGFGVAVTVEVGSRRRAWRSAIIYAGGLASGLAMWGWLHWPGSDPRFMQQLTAFNYTPAAAGGAIAASIANLSSLAAWGRSVFWTSAGPISLVEAALAVIGLAWAWRSGSAAQRVLATTAVIAMLVYGLAVSQRLVQYGVLWSPFWYLLGVGALVDAANSVGVRFPVEQRVIAGTTLVVTLLLAQLFAAVWLSYRYRGGNYRELESKLRALVPAGARVLADPVWWWALRDGRTFLSEEYFIVTLQTQHAAVRDFLGTDSQLQTTPALVRTLELLRPDYVALDNALACQDGPGEQARALLELVRARCRPAGTIAGAWLGDTGKSISQLAQQTTVYACSG